MRETPKLKIVHPEPEHEESTKTSETPSLFSDTTPDEDIELELDSIEPKVGAVLTEQREAIKKLGEQLLELREMLKTNQNR